MTPNIISSVWLVIGLIWYRIAKGASFCHVDRISPVVRSRPWSTSGSQKCIGASPIFMARAIVSVVSAVWLVISVRLHSPVVQAFMVLVNKIMVEAVACVRKYFVVASTARGWCCFAIIGMMASVLISNPIHASSQLELIKVIVVPSPRLRRRVVKMCGFISRGRILTNMFGVWAQKLF